MEVGWYLRFNVAGKLDVLADQGALPQLEHQLHILPEWTMQVQHEDTYIRASFTRIK